MIGRRYYNYIYIVTDISKYELPVMVSEELKSIAKFLGIENGSVLRAITRKSIVHKQYKIFRVKGE